MKGILSNVSNASKEGVERGHIKCDRLRPINRKICYTTTLCLLALRDLRIPRVRRVACGHMGISKKR